MDEWVLAIAVLGIVITLVGMVATCAWAVGRIRAATEVITSRIAHFEKTVCGIDRSLRDMGHRLNQHSARIIRLEERVIRPDRRDRGTERDGGTEEEES